MSAEHKLRHRLIYAKEMIKLMYAAGDISADAAGKLLIALGEKCLWPHPSREDVEDPEDRSIWIDADGHTWDFRDHKQNAWNDVHGHVWRWAGGWEWLQDAPGGKQPLMCRTDRPKQDVALCRVIAVAGPLTLTS